MASPAGTGLHASMCEPRELVGKGSKAPRLSDSKALFRWPLRPLASL